MTNFKVETGVQLLARLTRNNSITNFYPVLFQTGPKHGEVIEIFSESSVSCLLVDIICEALVPATLGGVESGVLIFNTDGNLNFDDLINCMRRKLLLYNEKLEQCAKSNEDLNMMLHDAFSNLYFLDIFDATQFHTTILNLETVLLEHSNISLIVFDTLTAFYWSDQGLKMIKMDSFVKNLLRLIQKVTKEYKITIMYTRPGYFNSNKDAIENLEACCEYPTLEKINYRIELCDCNGEFQVKVRTYNMQFNKSFTIFNDFIKWL